MIGVKPKKKKIANHPDFNLSEGQAAIYGKVTERNIVTNSITNATDAQVSVYKNGNLVGLAAISENGLYQITSISAGANYTTKFEKDSVFTTPVFTLSSKEVKQINVELTTDVFI